MSDAINQGPDQLISNGGSGSKKTIVIVAVVFLLIICCLVSIGVGFAVIPTVLKKNIDQIEKKAEEQRKEVEKLDEEVKNIQNGKSKDEKKDETINDANNDKADVPTTGMIPVGSIGKLDQWEVKVVGYEDRKGQFDDSEKYAVVEMEIKNNSDEEKTMSTILMLELNDKSGKNYSVGFMAGLKPEELLDKNMKAGESFTGKVAFLLEGDPKTEDLNLVFKKPFDMSDDPAVLNFNVK